MASWTHAARRRGEELEGGAEAELGNDEVRILRLSRGIEVALTLPSHRHLDALLSPHPSGAATSTTPAKTQGFLLLELTALRTYAHSRYFPTTDTQLLDGFLQDIRALEDSGTEAGKDVRRVLVERLWRWSDALGWSRIVEIK